MFLVILWTYVGHNAAAYDALSSEHISGLIALMTMLALFVLLPLLHILWHFWLFGLRSCIFDTVEMKKEEQNQQSKNNEETSAKTIESHVNDAFK